MSASAIAVAVAVFAPQGGGAGARGVTGVRLAQARASDLKSVLAQAAGKARNSRNAFTRLT